LRRRIARHRCNNEVDPLPPVMFSNNSDCRKRRGAATPGLDGRKPPGAHTKAAGSKRSRARVSGRRGRISCGRLVSVFAKKPSERRHPGVRTRPFG
jgi:hypothetical protein